MLFRYLFYKCVVVIRVCELYVCQCPCCHACTGAQVGAASPEARDKLALKNETDLKKTSIYRVQQAPPIGATSVRGTVVR